MGDPGKCGFVLRKGTAGQRKTGFRPAAEPGACRDAQPTVQPLPRLFLRWQMVPKGRGWWSNSSEDRSRTAGIQLRPGSLLGNRESAGAGSFHFFKGLKVRPIVPWFKGIRWILRSFPGRGNPTDWTKGEPGRPWPAGREKEGRSWSGRLRQRTLLCEFRTVAGRSPQVRNPEAGTVPIWDSAKPNFEDWEGCLAGQARV